MSDDTSRHVTQTEYTRAWTLKKPAERLIENLIDALSGLAGRLMEALMVQKPTSQSVENLPSVPITTYRTGQPTAVGVVKVECDSTQAGAYRFAEMSIVKAARVMAHATCQGHFRILVSPIRTTSTATGTA